MIAPNADRLGTQTIGHPPAPFNSSTSANQMDKGDRTACVVPPIAKLPLSVGTSAVISCCPNCSDATAAILHTCEC